jgi:oligosaccharide repeat unit polymerase
VGGEPAGPLGLSVRRRLDLAGLANPLVGFPILWFAGVALSQIHIFSFQRNWSAFVWAIMFLAPAGFILGGLVGRGLVARRVRAAREEPRALGPGQRRRLRMLLIACLVVGYAELAHQFAGVGSVPLFADNIDATRAAQPGGPLVVLTQMLTVAMILGLLAPPRLLSWRAAPELIVAGVAALGFLLAGGRGTIAIGVAGAVLARLLYWGLPRPRAVIGGLVLGYAAVSALFFVRADQHRGNAFEAELFDSVIPSTPMLLRPYLPLHVGLTTNFHVLDRLTGVFPSVHEWGGGSYSTSGFDAVVPGTNQLSDIAAQVAAPFITSTAAGPYFADGGAPGVVLGMALFGLVTVAAYTWARRTGSFVACMIGGYVTYMGLFGVYTNLFTEHPDWAIVIPALALAGYLVRQPDDHGPRQLAAGLLDQVRHPMSGHATGARS